VSGDTSPFNLFIASEAVKDAAKTYDLGLEWQDQQGNEFTSDVLSNQPFTPGAVSARSISSSSSSSGGGGGNGGNDGEFCVIFQPGLNMTDHCFRPGECPEGYHYVGDGDSGTCYPDDISCPESQVKSDEGNYCVKPLETSQIECGEGFASNPSTGQCEPVSVPTPPGNGEEEGGGEEGGGEGGGGEGGGGEGGGGEGGGGEGGGGEGGGGEGGGGEEE
jgi:hypothetical protein